MKPQGLTSFKVISLATVSLALASAWIYLAYKSYSFKAEVSGIEAEAQSKLSEDSYLISVRNVLRDAEDELATIDARFIDKENIPDFIGLLESEAAKAGVKADFGSINVDAQSLSVRLTGSGTWQSVIGFVSTLDSLPYALSINSLGLQRSEGTTVEGMWNFNVGLTQYVTETKNEQI